MPEIRIVIADDHTVLREGLKESCLCYSHPNVVNGLCRGIP